MDKFKIEIEVNLGKDTLDALTRLGSALATSAAIPTIQPQPQASKPETKTEPTPAPQITPESLPVPAPTPVADDDDLPPDDAPSPKTAKNIPTEAEMRAEIQATRKRGVPAKTIREYIKSTFGVETSVECPEDRRQELINGLANLAA